MIVTVTLNAALHVAYAVLAPGGTIPPRTPLLTGGLPAPPYPLAPPAPPAPPSRSPVLTTGQAGAG